MKKLFKILMVAIIGLTITSCKKNSITDSNTSDVILINFINKTNHNILSAKANEATLGNFDKNSKTGYIKFDTFRKDTQMPDCNFTGIVNGDSIKSTSLFYFCGTEKEVLQPGKYNIEVIMQTVEGKQYFHLRFI